MFLYKFFILKIKDSSQKFYLIKDESDNIVGRINLIDIEKENRAGNIGYRIGEDFLKKGIATNALKFVLVDAIKHNVNEIYA